MKKVKISWVIKVFIFSFVLSAGLSFLSDELLNSLSVVIAFIILFIFIVVGIVFDIIGLSFATVSPKPFHSMSAQKIPAGKKALRLIKDAEIVSNICNDVIGDIAGVVSGATAASIIAALFLNSEYKFIYSLLITGAVSAMTVGGKAIGKTIAINFNKEIVTFVAKFLCLFQRNTKNRKKDKKKGAERQ